MEVLSIKGCKSIDRDTIDKIGIPSIVLMENAASEIVNIIKDYGEKILILVGNGNNGGDGLAVARKLSELGKCVKVYIVNVSSKNSDDFNINLKILNNLGVITYRYEETVDGFLQYAKDCDYIVDAIFGVGLNREVSGIAREAIRQVNLLDKKVFSIDIPSGLNGDTGEEMGIAINAKMTLSIEVLKRGFFNYKTQHKLGEVKVIKIGIPRNVKSKFSEGTHYVSRDDLNLSLLKREIYGHKGTYGKILIFAGSIGFTGAGYIVMESAIRCGSGLVTLLVPKEIQDVLAEKAVEGMVKSYYDEGIPKLIEDADVIVCGPGIGQSEECTKKLKEIINKSKCSLVLDADALNIISGDDTLYKSIEGRAILTPHPGEMARLLNCSIQEIENNRVENAKRLAIDRKVTVLLKGYNTIVTDGTLTYINSTGSSKMANGGMGDCLSGIIASLIGQGLSVLNAGVVASYLHGYIGDRIGEHSHVVTARDIINNLPNMLVDLINLE